MKERISAGPQLGREYFMTKAYFIGECYDLVQLCKPESSGNVLK